MEEWRLRLTLNWLTEDFQCDLKGFMKDRSDGGDVGRRESAKAIEKGAR